MADAFDIRRIELADDQTVQSLGRMAGVDRLRMVDELVRMARRIALAGIRATHPDWSEDRVQRELVARVAHGPG